LEPREERVQRVNAAGPSPVAFRLTEAAISPSSQPASHSAGRPGVRAGRPALDCAVPKARRRARRGATDAAPWRPAARRRQAWTRDRLMRMDPDRWLVLRVEAEGAEARGAVAEALIALGGAAVEEQGDALVTYVVPPRDPEAFLAEAAETLRAAAGPEPRLSWSWQANQDWAERWRRGLGARRVGRRLVVTPSWVRPRARRGDIVIVIDPE